VDVPPTAYTLDFVVSDQAKDNWDNNDGNDYRLLVESGGATQEDWDARIKTRVVELGKLRVIAAAEVERKRKERKKRKQDEVGAVQVESSLPIA
jgi:starch synthase